MLTFWLVTGLDDRRWEIIEREDGTRFHRKEGHVLWLAGLPETAPEDRLTPTSMRSNPLRLGCIPCRHPPTMIKDFVVPDVERPTLRKSAHNG
jgi:hypothetical protein